MKVAVVYNSKSQRYINKLGAQNREKYGAANIKRVTDALTQGGHQVIKLEGDRDLVDRLEEFMPAVLTGERPGMVFNLAYGIQGVGRYTHVPSILEMIGLPYVGSGPIAHSLALDKVVAKMIFRQHDIPTPAFAVLETPDFEAPDLPYPLIVKPKNEAVSMGIKVVNDEAELREAAGAIFEAFQQAVLVEQYIEGREINVGLLGNDPPEALPPCELDFGDGPKVYSIEDKKKTSGREVKLVCPAPLDEELAERAKDISRRAFLALGCFDCARVDLRIDADGNLYVLEINSLPSLGKSGSYVAAAATAGLAFPALVNRLVEVASARYFGTPTPPSVSATSKGDVPDTLFSYLTQRRDRMERKVAEWVKHSSRTGDALGLRAAATKLEKTMGELSLSPVEELTDGRTCWTWQTDRGLKDGTLLVAQLDVPTDDRTPRQAFRKEPEWLFGEGIAASRASLVIAEFALRALRSVRKLRSSPIGVLVYGDEGVDCHYSHDRIAKAMASAKRVLVLRPANRGAMLVTRRRGHRVYRVQAESKPARVGRIGPKHEVFLWLAARLQQVAELPTKKGLAFSPTDVSTDAFRMYVPHHVTATVRAAYANAKALEEAEEKMRLILSSSEFHSSIDVVSDRPPLTAHANDELLATLRRVAERWHIPLEEQSSVWPSVAGLAPPEVASICGLGAEAADSGTPREAITRMSLMQRTLLLTQLLAAEEA